MSKILRYAKFAEEPTFDLDAAAPAPQFAIDIGGATLDVPADTQATWEGGIGRGPRVHRPSYYHVPGNVVAAADVHTLGWWLRWALGGYAFTPDAFTAGQNLHEAWGSTDTVLPSFTSWVGKDLFAQVVRGCMVSQLQLQVSDGFVQLTVDLLGAKDAKGALDEAVIAQLPQPPPLTFPHLQFWVGGAASGDERSHKITDLTLTVNNNGDAPAGRGLGSRFARRAIPAGQRDTQVQFTTWYDSTEHIERVWGDPAGPSDDGSTELPLHIKADSGDDGNLNIALPRVLFGQVQTQPSGRSRIDQQVTATALLDTVTLDDGVTDVETEVYTRLLNDRDAYGAAA